MNQYATNEELDIKVLHILLLHMGKQNALDRWALVYQVYGEHVPLEKQNDDNPQDRAIRRAVFRLRNEGHLICNLGEGSGYYFAKTEAEFWELYEFYKAPIKARARTLKAMKDSAKKKFPNLLQPSLFEIPEMEISV